MNSSGLPNVSPALNCIVDESALLAGLRDNQQDSLTQWISTGYINLFVPLYTALSKALEQLNNLRNGSQSSSQDAMKVLGWLDRITTATESKLCGRVELQGPEDQYASWSEVEQYLLPDTPFSTPNGTDLDGVVEEFETSVNLNEKSTSKPSLSVSATNTFSMNPASPSFTPKKPYVNNSPAKEVNGSMLSTSTHLDSPDSRVSSHSSTAFPSIPARVRPLLNFVVWRTYNNDSAIRDTGKYILLTNDLAIQKQAQKFGVRAKMLSQLRTIVGKDNDRLSQDFAVTQAVHGLFNSSQDTIAGGVETSSISEGEDEGEDEVVFNPTKRPTSSQKPIKVWDPDHFGRTQPSVDTKVETPVSSPTTKRAPGATPHGRKHKGDSSRGNGGGRARASGQSNNRQGSNRGGRGSTTLQVARQPKHQFTKPIDPDSYDRPQPVGGKRGRGASRRLWDPNPT